jgi:recombination protein RecA
MSDRVEQLHELLTEATLRRGEIQPECDSAPWSLANLTGRLTEISGQGAVAPLTAAIGLVVEAQSQSEPVAWITLPESVFYPPDANESGVDLDALAVVRAPCARDAARAADRLVRSGAFGLVILDIGADDRISDSLQGRLVGLAQKHDAAIVCLTEKPSDSPSIGSMVSLRVEVMRETVEHPQSSTGFRSKVKVLKDKRRGPNWQHSEILRGPAGLR